MIAAEATGASLVERLQRPPAGDPGADRADRARRRSTGCPPAAGSRSPRSPACPTWPPRSSPRARSRRRRWRCFVLAFALALQSAPRAAGDAGRRRRAWRSVVGVCLLLARGERLHLQRPRARLVRDRGPALARARGARRPQPGRLGRGRATGSPPTGVTLAVAARDPDRDRRGRLRARRASFVDKIGDVQDSAGRLELAGLPRRGARDLAGGRLPDRPRRGRRRLLAVALGALAAALGAWSLLRAGAARAAGDAGRRRRSSTSAPALFAEIHVEAKALAVIAPLVVLVAPAGAAAPRAEQRATSLLALRAPARSSLVAAALSTLLALRDAPVGFDERQLGLERLAERGRRRAVAFLGVDRFSGYCLRGTLARAPPATCPRRSPRARRRSGSRAWRPTSTRSTPASSTSSTTRSRPRPPTSSTAAAELRAGRRAPATTCSGSASGETPARARCSRRGRRHPGAILDCPSGRADAAGARRVVLAEPAVADYTRLEARRRRRTRGSPARSSASQAPGERDDHELDLPEPRRLRALAPVPLPGAADRALRRRADRRAAAVARRHVPERRRARRLLAGGRGRRRGRRRARGHRPRRRARAGSQARSAPSGWSGSATSPPRRRRRRGRSPLARRLRRATSTTTPTTQRGRAADAALRHPRRGAVAGARRRDARARARGARSWSSSAAPGAAAPTCSRS